MASMGREKYSLRREITRATQWPNKEKGKTAEGDSVKFVPAAAIKNLTTESIVKRALGELSHEGILRRICSIDPPVKKIFLILARAEMLNMVEKFIFSNFSDQDLPIRIFEDDSACVVQSAQPSRSSDNLLWDSGLTYPYMERFVIQQWQFLSPIFGKGFKFELRPGIALPLIEKDDGAPAGFSVVSRVKVHPSHISKEPSDVLAMKELNLDIDDQAECLVREMPNLTSLQHLDHDHLIKPVAICTREKRAFFFFQWADGGDLYKFWKKHAPDGRIPWMLDQMIHLSDALTLLASWNCRHSDLKPQNILLFHDDTNIGTLKITDVGISKFHILATSKRVKGTTAKSATERYSPPEFHRLSDDKLRDHVEGPDSPKLSRRFDIWSLGCIFVEFIIWARLGKGMYKRFDDEMQNSAKFWELEPSTPVPPDVEPRAPQDLSHYHVHRTVETWIKYLQRKLSQTRDDTIFREILGLVEKSMLVVDYKKRCSASEVHDRLKAIQDRNIPLREQQLSNTGNTATLEVNFDEVEPFANSEGLTTTTVPQDNVAAQRYNKRQIAKLRDRWTVTTDNKPAEAFFSRAVIPVPRKSSALCPVCSTFRIWEPESKISGSVGGFKARSTTCGMCKLLYSVSKRVGLRENEHLRCVRNGSTMNFENQPVLSLFADPGNTHGLEFSQVGYPTLFPTDSPLQYQLLRQWLHVCDTEHGHNPEAYKDSLQMPTRLIHIEDSRERLDVIQGSSSLRYAALSHCWGNSPKLCTLTSNLEAFRKEIPHNLLPLNFQEAIRVARALGIPYLWIDSLCIVQDDLADWEREAGRMGQVFSNAYCTIAATSAAASDEGFLARQTDPPLSAAIEAPGGGILHVSEFMEDYHQDLELAPLNTRGWVLQERALSRRTLHFTKTQVYWECGAGVHCERLFKLSNPQATLFADSDFPQAILKHFKGGRITLFQHLYQTYSRLSFSHISDRSVAILGLEKRLLDAFQTRGGFGIFEVYLARSLLWSRQEDVFLNLIPCTKSRPPPSWSWMAYQGPITYMEIPFDQVDWTTDCVFPSDSEIATNTQGPALKTLARELTMSRLDLIHRVKLDQQAEIRVSDLRGVVLGKDKRRESREPMHYVLLITLSRDQLEGREVYVRAGVAWLLEHNVAPVSEEVEVY